MKTRTGGAGRFKRSMDQRTRAAGSLAELRPTMVAREHVHVTVYAKRVVVRYIREAKISRASAVKEHPACARLQARSLLARTACSKNGAFELRLGHEYRYARQSVINHMFSLIEVYLASECFQAVSWFILQNNALIGDRELDGQ
jgi:hypothetical protein